MAATGGAIATMAKRVMVPRLVELWDQADGGQCVIEEGTAALGWRAILSQGLLLLLLMEVMVIVFVCPLGGESDGGGSGGHNYQWAISDKEREEREDDEVIRGRVKKHSPDGQWVILIIIIQQTLKLQAWPGIVVFGE